MVIIMNIELKAKVTLTIEDIQQAVTNYINDNGLEIGDKEVTFIAFPETLTVEIEGADAPKAEPKVKPKTRTRPTVTPQPSKASTPDTVQALTEKAEEDREALLEIERKLAAEQELKRAEASAKAKEVLEAGNALLNSSKTQPSSNPLAALTSSDTPQEDESYVNEEVGEPLAGQDILDGVQEQKPDPVKIARFNPFDPPATATPDTVEVVEETPKVQAVPVVNRQSIFG